MPGPNKREQALRAKVKAAPRFREMLKDYRANEQISIGPPPKDPKKAWWYLPVKTRKLLDQMRDQGRFGGVPGTAPYWNIQERGLPEVGIKAIQYLDSAVKEWEQRLGIEVRQWIGSKPFSEQGH